MCQLSHVLGSAWLLLRPLPYTWLVGYQVWLGASFATFSSVQSASLGRTGAGEFVVASEMISQKAVTHHRKPCLFFSLTFPQASCSTHLCICSHIPHQQTAAYFWLQSTAGSRDGSGRENGIPLPTTMPMRAAGLCSMPWHLPAELCVNFHSMTSAKSFFPCL